MNSDMNEINLEKLSKAEVIKMVEKLQKPKIVIAHDDNGQVPQPRKTPKHIPPEDPKTGRLIKIHPDRPKPPKQPALPGLKDAKGRFVSRKQSEPVVQHPPIHIRENQKAQKPIGKPVPALMIKNQASKIEKLDQALKSANDMKIFILLSESHLKVRKITVS